MIIDFTKNLIIGHKSLPDWDKCDEAKQLLDEAKISYAYLVSDKWSFGNIMKETGSKQVPQIVIDGEFIGGVDKLKEHLENVWAITMVG